MLSWLAVVRRMSETNRQTNVRTLKIRETIGEITLESGGAEEVLSLEFSCEATLEGVGPIGAIEKSF